MPREHAFTKSLTLGAVVLVGLAAAQPLCAAAGRLPWAADTLIHLYRLVELDHLLRHGYPFPRYAPDLAYGFGFPLLNFYAPLSYYIAEIFRLIGMDFSPALAAAFVVLVIGAGLAMYAWAADVWGQRAGIVAAAAYVTAPYLLYNVYHRGALAEVLAMALMPALLWAMTRLARDGTRKFFILTALLYAALLLGHNVTAIVFTPVIVVYAGVLFTEYGIRNTQHVFRIPYSVFRVALAILLGLGLAAFFWVPMFLERNSVQIYQLFLPEAFDYRFHFITPGELLSPPMTVDPNLVLPPTPRSIGLGPLALAIIALVFGWKRWSREQRATATFAALLALVSLLLALPQSRPAWDALSILRFVQFPWRFLGPASLALAFLAGSALAEFSPQRRQDTKSITETTAHPQTHKLGVLVSWWLVGLAITGLIVYGFTWQYVPFLAPIIHPTVADIARYERESGALGTTSAGDYMPNTVKKLPDANALTERYARSDVIERLDPASLPPDARLVKVDYHPLSADVTVESRSPFTATFDIFHFAGWQARVDGRPIPISPTYPHGLIRVPIPSGQHRIQVFFGSTPLRTTAEMASLASVLALIAASVVFARPPINQRTTEQRRINPTSPIDGAQPSSAASLSPRALVLVCVIAIGLIAFKSLYLDSRETIFRRTRFDGTRIAGVAHPVNVSFDNQMVLMGYEPEAPVTEMGGTVRVTLYWRAARKLDTDYAISAQLVDERGFVYGQRDSQHPGGYPTSRWMLTDYARDIHDIALAPGTPPGMYRLRVGVYRVGAPKGLDVLDANGAPSGTTVDVATVQVIRPDRGWPPPRLAMPQPDHPSGAQLAPGILLYGYDLPQAEIDAGAKLPFTLYWQATSAQKRDLKAQLQLADTNGAVVFSVDVAPISTQFPTSRLLAGDVLRRPNAVLIPTFTPGGTFALRLILTDETGAAQGNATELGRVTVRVPERIMIAPRAEHSTQINIGDQISLTGYDLGGVKFAPGARLTVTLYWQAQREMANDYKAFVHLLDATGRLIVGSDAIPADWTRPTTGWIAGEYVADLHTLLLPANLPPGEYRIEVGLYDADSNLRLGSSVILDQAITITP